MASGRPVPETPRRASIRALLLRLVLAVALPLAALAAWNLYDEYQEQSRQARDRVFHLAQVTASETAKFLGQSRNILNGFAARPAVRAFDPARCDPILKEFLGLAPRFANILTVTATGVVACSAVPLPGAAPRKVDTDEFQRLRDGVEFGIGNPVKLRLTDQWLVPIGKSLRDAQGGFAGAVVLMLDLVRYPVLPSVEGLPANTVVGLITADGTVLARSLQAERFVGTRAGANRPALRGKSGTAELPGIDGIARVQGFAPVAGSDWVAIASIPAANVYAGIKKRALASVLAAIAILGAALLLAARATREIREPIVALARVSQEVAAGNQAERAALTGAAEIAEVAEQFNRMLDARERAEADLRASEQRFRLAVSSGDVWDANILTGEVRIAERFYQALGYQAGEIENTTAALESLIHPEDRARWKQAVADHLRRRLPYQLEFRARTKSGDVRWFATRGHAMRDATGRATYMAGTTFDITERKHADEAMKEAGERLQGLSRHLIHVQEEERIHIARELHDELGQALTAVKIRLQSAGGAETHRETVAILDQALAQVRGLSLDLHPPQLDDLGLGAALRAYIDRAFSGMTPKVELGLPPGLPPVAPGIALAAYRIAQEAIGNAARHAAAHSIRVTLAASAGALTLEVVDDGRGFDPEVARAQALRGASLGLVSMEERARLAGGELMIRSTPGAGTTITARLPL